jgi:3-methyladenine DNA glycosylase AlkD
LYETNIYEARILCSKIFNPKNLTEDLMDKWTSEFENWEVCDSFCMKLFAKSKWAIPKILEWTQREREFEKRAGFTVMAAYCMADKKAENEVFTSFLPIIEREADDNRIYVKKAVNWALRSIGKRNRDLQQIAIQWAKKIAERDSKAAKWITSNALKELEKDGVRISDYPRKIYRK